MTRLRFLFALLVLVISGCSVSSEEETASTEEELRSVATGFFVRAPLSGARLETLRRAIGGADDGYAWTRNQGTFFAMQWESQQTTPLTDAERASLAQAAFVFHLRLGDASARNRRYLGQLGSVATTDEGIDAAVDHVGLSASSGDADTLAARTTIVTALRTAARTPSVSVLKATLHYQVDMYWENALVIIDERYRQILVVTGGYGT